MVRIPFGVSRFDSQVGGGAPAGSVVLLSGESGAGAREFLHTSAVMNGLQAAPGELFDLHYGDLSGAAVPPEGIHYISFTGTEQELRNEISLTMDDEIVDSGLDVVTFADLSPEYFQLSPVPREWYAGEHRTIADLGQQKERRDLLEAFADNMDENASGGLVLVDSLTDLLASPQGERSWSDIVLTIKGLRKAAASWNGLILLLVNQESLTSKQLGMLMAAVDGTIQFEWESGGNERVRTMFVREFRGVLSQLEDEDIIRFETEVHEAGFDVSGVRKIR